MSTVGNKATFGRAQARVQSSLRKSGSAGVSHAVVLISSLLFGTLALLFVGLARDFEGYAGYFAILRGFNLDEIIAQRFEPVFAILSMPLAGLLASDVAVMASLAMLAFYLKCLALRRLSIGPLTFVLVLVFFLVRFAPLHEFTQIRIALALSVWLLAISRAQDKLFWLLLVLLPLTHYSAIVLVPFTLAWRLLKTDPQRYLRIERFFWLGTSTLVVLVGIVMMMLIPYLAIVFIIIDVYSNTSSFGDAPVNLFNLPTLLDIVFLLAFFAVGFFARSTPEQRFWLWMQLVGLIVFVAMRNLPIISHRMHEMFNLSWMLYLACTVLLRDARGQLSRLYLGICIPVYVYLYAFSADALIPI